MLTLPRQLSEALRLTPAQFAELCAANPEAVLELAADGRLIEMAPAGGETGRRNNQLAVQLGLWARLEHGWCVFDSSTGFLLPDGSVLSPDASAVRLERWQALSSAEREGFPPLCPDLVVELASPSDRLPDLRRKMAAYQANGARVGWLLLPEIRGVEVWRASGEPQRLKGLAVLDGEPELPGLRLELEEIWNA
ncbi:Uma2 family endonuclease [Microcystis elabens FACHB-917]|nr:Uma2 family endonuclease [Microcystis elabens FACHB-917]